MSYTRVLHKNANTMEGIIRTRSATDPNINATVMVANCIWYTANVMAEMAGAVLDRALKLVSLSPMYLRFPLFFSEKKIERAKKIKCVIQL